MRPASPGARPWHAIVSGQRRRWTKRQGTFGASGASRRTRRCEGLSSGSAEWPQTQASGSTSPRSSAPAARRMTAWSAGASLLSQGSRRDRGPLKRMQSFASWWLCMGPRTGHHGAHSTWVVDRTLRAGSVGEIGWPRAWSRIAALTHGLRTRTQTSAMASRRSANLVGRRWPRPLSCLHAGARSTAGSDGWPSGVRRGGSGVRPCMRLRTRVRSWTGLAWRRA